MQNNTSSIVLNNVTVIDHAYIDNEGNVVGGSFQASFHVQGKIDQKEKVVVDFSTIKKSLKELVDDNEEGFDHKLWIINGYSNISSVSHINNTLCIETPQINMETPLNAIKFIHNISDLLIPNYDVDFISFCISDFLQEKLQKIYPDIEIHVNTILTTEIGITDLYGYKLCEPRFFRYVHGLKDSTSWGCQNIAHGHLSFIAAYTIPRETTQESYSKAIQVLNEIVDYMDSIIFINNENITQVDDFKQIISYTTNRGYFEMVLKNKYTRRIILETETTIEFITEFVKQRFGQKLYDAGVRKIIVSEGLTKGSIIDISSNAENTTFKCPKTEELYNNFLST
ncbi:MAG: hypothetical protein KDH96_02870 [Candidatus Riesia sp.]|nr:hypothetical protein [Candidatus Riesia sp.]